MIRSSKYMIKRIIIGIGIAIGVMCFKNYVSFAATIDSIYVNGGSNNLTGWWYKPANQGGTFDFIGVGPESVDDNIYFNMLMCTDATSGTAWASASDPNTYSMTRSNTTINFTEIPCYVKDTNFKAHVVQVQSVTRTGADGGGDIRLYIHVSFNQDASISVNSYSFTANQYPLVYSEKDYTNQLNSMMTTITNTWQTQINKLQDIWQVDQATLAEAQTQTGWQKRMAEAAEAFNRAVNDDGIDENDQDSKMNTIKNSGYNNASISDIILLPVKVFQTAVNGLSSNSCTPINLGNLYNTDLILPCISSSDMQNWLSVSVYSLIDALMSFGVILGIRKLVIKIYRTIVYLRDGGATID